MKKKIINGILMVALLAATTTSFVSCKDNDEDVKTDLIAQLQTKANALDVYTKAQVDALDDAIKADLANKADASELEKYAKLTDLANYSTTEEMNTAITNALNGYATEGYVDNAITDVWTKLNDLSNPESVASRLKAINDKISDPDSGIDAINTELDDVEDKLKELEHQIHSIVTTLEKLVTSVTVNGTASSILANSKVFPGLNVQILGAAYGEPIKPTGDFPSTNASLYVDGNALSADAIAGVENSYRWKDNNLINSEDFNAGTVYFTLNPSNIKPKALKSLTLVNNRQEEIFELGEATSE